MKSSVQREGPTSVRLSVEISLEEFEGDVGRAVRRLSLEVKVPGFRKGHVPRAVLESRLGKKSVRSTALEDAIRRAYPDAVADQRLSTVADPEIEVDQFEEGHPVSFTATVQVKPDITLPEYRGIEVDRPSAAPTEEEIFAEVDRLRDRYATLEEVGRPAQDDDYVLIDVNASEHNKQLEAAGAKDALYRVGSGGLVDELDEHLRGKRPGDILKFNAVLPERFGDLAGREPTFSVIVKEVKAKKVPELDDTFAKMASEFDTLEELKADITSKIGEHKKIEAESQVRNKIVDELLARVDLPLPEALVEQETGHRLNRILTDLEKASITLEDFLAASETTQQDFVEKIREQARETVAAELILDEVARVEEISVLPHEIDDRIAALAQRYNRDAAEMQKQMRSSGAVAQVASDIIRAKALDLLVTNAQVRTPEK